MSSTRHRPGRWWPHRARAKHRRSHRWDEGSRSWMADGAVLRRRVHQGTRRSDLSRPRQYSRVHPVDSPAPPATNQDLVTLADIRAAALRIRGIALRTPLLPLADGAWIKPESFQPTGSFKIRGAYNALAGLSPE